MLALWRGHWGMENRVHGVRDVTFDEDRCQVRCGAAPQVMAALRNVTISLLRLADKANMATALRRHSELPRAGVSAGPERRHGHEPLARRKRLHPGARHARHRRGIQRRGAG